MFYVIVKRLNSHNLKICLPKLSIDVADIGQEHILEEALHSNLNFGFSVDSYMQLNDSRELQDRFHGIERTRKTNLTHGN